MKGSRSGLPIQWVRETRLQQAWRTRYVRGRSLGEISLDANRVAAWVASQLGATPVIDERRFEETMDGVS
jgi:hypothetical protein